MIFSENFFSNEADTVFFSWRDSHSEAASHGVFSQMVGFIYPQKGRKNIKSACALNVYA